MGAVWTIEAFACEGQPATLTASLNTVDEVLLFVEEARENGHTVRITPPEPRNRLDRRQFRDEVAQIASMAGSSLRPMPGSSAVYVTR